MPILDWLLRANGSSCAIEGSWADLRRLQRPPAGLARRIVMSFDLYPCELLFVRRDAEGEAYDSRRSEIEAALASTTFEGEDRPVSVCVVPVRMREAWLLFDESAIRRAAGNPAGVVPLELPRLNRCEDLPNPKQLLHDLLRTASELGSRRRRELSVGPLVHRVAEFTRDFYPLRALPAFAMLEEDIRSAIAENGWNRR